MLDFAFLSKTSFFRLNIRPLNIRNETMFGYVPCDPNVLVERKANFPIPHLFSKLLPLPETIMGSTCLDMRKKTIC